ncbi:hypothetical protein Tco_0114008 [Tanacetum coccineum]
MPPRVTTRSAGRPVAESQGRRTGERIGRGGRRVRGPKEGNDERVDELNGQGNDQGLRDNGGVEGVNRNVEEVNRVVGGAPDLLMIDICLIVYVKYPGFCLIKAIKMPKE